LTATLLGFVRKKFFPYIYLVAASLEFGASLVEMEGAVHEADQLLHEGFVADNEEDEQTSHSEKSQS